MGRLGIYLKDKIEKEIRDIVQIELQNGASPSEANMSAQCNELLRMGLIMHKAKNSEDTFNQKDWNRDMIRKVSGSREGIVLMLSMITEIYLHTLNDHHQEKVESLLGSYLDAIGNAEDEAENHHFVSEESAD